MAGPELTHLGAQGRARMVDVGEKPVTRREAVARGRVWMRPATLERIRQGGVAKGDVLAVAQVAGVQAAKDTGRLIPLCHPLPLDGVDLAFAYLDPGPAAAAPDGWPPGAEPPAALEIEARVRVTARTGAEMEALAAVSVAALTVYDMCKAVDRDMVIGAVRLVAKAGGRSGAWRRAGEPGAG